MATPATEAPRAEPGDPCLHQPGRMPTLLECAPSPVLRLCEAVICLLVSCAPVSLTLSPAEEHAVPTWELPNLPWELLVGPSLEVCPNPPTRE